MTLTRAILFGACLALAGCAATTNPESPGPDMQIFTDLPAAPGLTYDKGYGHVTPSGGLRVYDQDYSGQRALEATKDWYVRTFPSHGWTQKSAEGTNPATLTFEKKMEKAVITLHDDRGTLHVHVAVMGK